MNNKTEVTAPVSPLESQTPEQTIKELATELRIPVEMLTGTKASGVTKEPIKSLLAVEHRKLVTQGINSNLSDILTGDCI